MQGHATAETPSAAPAPLLPPGLIWVYAVAPLATALLMADELLRGSPPELLRRVGANYVPFIAFGTTFHFVYRYGVPLVLRLLRSAWLRVLCHLTTVVLVSLGVAWCIHPIVEVMCGRSLPLPEFAASSVVISSCCLFPALLVQHLRLRALAAEHEAMAERQAALQAQLETLQARTNPHFLFNSLNTVASLIPEDPRQAERILERLADLFRYALESSRTRAVPLRREIDMISDYLAVQSARFGERLRTRVEMDESLANVEVPPLLLQPLVENAIVHGTAHRKGGEVRIAVHRDGDVLVIEVVDDGPGPGGSDHAGSGSAVAGIAERLRLHYAGRGQLALERLAEGGCLARVTLPLSGFA